MTLSRIGNRIQHSPDGTGSSPVRVSAMHAARSALPIPANRETSFAAAQRPLVTAAIAQP